MDSHILAESIKDYVYTKHSLSSDPQNATLLSRLAEICLRVGMYRSAATHARCAYQLNGSQALLDIVDCAESWLRENCGKYCSVACGVDGLVFTADRECNTLSARFADGTVLWQVDREGIEDDALYRPDAIAAAPDGRIYVVSSILSRIQVFGRDGGFIRVFNVPKRFGTRVEISDVSCSPDGDLWIVDSLSRSLILLDQVGEEIKRIAI